MQNNPAWMPKHCTNVMFTFQVVARECQKQSPLGTSTNLSTHRFLTVQVSVSLKMPQERRLPLKLLVKFFLWPINIFERLVCRHCFWISRECPGSLTTNTSMQCAHNVIMQMCYYQAWVGIWYCPGGLFTLLPLGFWPRGDEYYSRELGARGWIAGW